MNLFHLLNARRAAGKPVRVALIGAGKFGSMFLSQVPHTPGLEVSVIVDLDPEGAREACRTVGWDAARIEATTFTADAAKATSGDIEVIVEATGNPAVGIKHARAAIAAGKHIVMVNVEADVLAGPLVPPCGVEDLPLVRRPRDKGGVLEQWGLVEVVSSLERDGRPVFRDLRWGVYVVLEAPNDYAADCFRQYGLKTDSSGRYAAMYKPYHLIGLELNISILSAALRREPTGQPFDFRGDVASVAKRNLQAGERLDGEGGYTVWGRLMPAAASLKAGALPIGLAHGVKLKNDIAHGAGVRWSDVEIGAGTETIKTRRAMEAKFGG